MKIRHFSTRVRTFETEQRKRKREKWLAENREAIAAYNAYVAREGVLSPMFRENPSLSRRQRRSYINIWGPTGRCRPRRRCRR